MMPPIVFEKVLGVHDCGIPSSATFLAHFGDILYFFLQKEKH